MVGGEGTVERRDCDGKKEEGKHLERKWGRAGSRAKVPFFAQGGGGEGRRGTRILTYIL